MRTGIMHPVRVRKRLCVSVLGVNRRFTFQDLESISAFLACTDTHGHFRLAIETSRKIPIVCGGSRDQKPQLTKTNAWIRSLCNIRNVVFAASILSKISNYMFKYIHIYRIVHWIS